MVKSNKCKSFKMYLFAGSLILLFIVTLAMTTNVFAGAPCPDLRQFNCTVTETCNGEIVNSYEECFNLCNYGDYATLNSGCFSFNLEFLNSRNLLGIDNDLNPPVGGCFFTFKGRSMTGAYMPFPD